MNRLAKVWTVCPSHYPLIMVKVRPDVHNGTEGSSVPVVWLEDVVRDLQTQRSALPIWFLVCV